MNLTFINKKSLALILAITLALSTSGCQLTSKYIVEEKVPQNNTVSNENSQSLSEIPKIEVTKEGENAYQWLKTIEEKWPIREAGTETEKEAGKALGEILEGMGLRVSLQNFEFVSEAGQTKTSQNVVASLSPKEKKRIVIGAHYDSVNIGSGADDNGSGVAVVLTLADYLKDKELPYGVDFVLFGAEEVGIFGSEAYVQKIKDEKATLPILMINFDSLIAGDIPNVYVGKENDPHLGTILELAKAKGLPLQTQNEERSGLPYGTSIDASDHAAFKNNDIPILYFEGTNWSAGRGDGYTQTLDPKVKNGEIWHTENDNLDQIEIFFGDRPLQRLSLFTEAIILFLEQFKA